MDEKLSDHMRRAMAAFFKSGATDQPAMDLSGIEDVEGKKYVVLRNVNGILAVYRIRPDGSLKRLKRWPKELEKG